MKWLEILHLQELDITATDIGKECLMDVLTRIPALRWLSAGQLDAMTDNVMKVCWIPGDMIAPGGQLSIWLLLRLRGFLKK